MGEGNTATTKCKTCNAPWSKEANSRYILGDKGKVIYDDLKQRNAISWSYQAFLRHFNNFHHLPEDKRKIAKLAHSGGASQMIEAALENFRQEFDKLLANHKKDSAFDNVDPSTMSIDDLERLALHNKTAMLADINILEELRNTMVTLGNHGEDEKVQVSASRVAKEIQKTINESRQDAADELERIIKNRREMLKAELGKELFSSPDKNPTSTMSKEAIYKTLEMLSNKENIIIENPNIKETGDTL